jgi:hypothetical protein
VTSRGVWLCAPRDSRLRMARHVEVGLIEIARQVRSTAADLVRASRAGAPDDNGVADASTEAILTDRDPSSSDF